MEVSTQFFITSQSRKSKLDTLKVTISLIKFTMNTNDDDHFFPNSTFIYTTPMSQIIGDELVDSIMNIEDQSVLNKSRVNWGNDIEFLISCIALSVGLGVFLLLH